MWEFVGPEGYSEYEAFIQSHPKGHFCQSYKWGLLKNDWKWYGILSRDKNGKPRGALSVMVRKMPGMPWSILYGCRGPVCGLDDRECLAELIDGAKRLAKRHRGYAIKLDPDVLSSNEPFVSMLGNFGFRPVPETKNFESIQPRYVFRLEMNGRGEEEMLASFESKTRYNIRVAQKHGVEVAVESSDEALTAFADIMKETGERDRFITRNRGYFARMLECLGNNARLYMARYQDRYVAGALAIHYGDKVWYLYGASSNADRNVMPNYLLQYEMIKWAVETGARIYDFRGISGDLSPDNPLYGLYRFKKGFNGDLCEFVSEMDLTISPLGKLMVDKLSKLYKKLRRIIYRRR